MNVGFLQTFPVVRAMTTLSESVHMAEFCLILGYDSTARHSLCASAVNMVVLMFIVFVIDRCCSRAAQGTVDLVFDTSVKKI